MPVTKVRPLEVADIPAVAALYAASSPRRFGAPAWVTCNANAFPRMQ